MHTGGFCCRRWLRWKSGEVLLVVCRTGCDRVVLGRKKASMGAKGVRADGNCGSSLSPIGQIEIDVEIDVNIVEHENG